MNESILCLCAFSTRFLVCVLVHASSISCNNLRSWENSVRAGQECGRVSCTNIAVLALTLFGIHISSTVTLRGHHREAAVRRVTAPELNGRLRKLGLIPASQQFYNFPCSRNGGKRHADTDLERRGIARKCISPSTSSPF